MRMDEFDPLFDKSPTQRNSAFESVQQAQYGGSAGIRDLENIDVREKRINSLIHPSAARARECHMVSSLTNPESQVKNMTLDATCRKIGTNLENAHQSGLRLYGLWRHDTALGERIARVDNQPGVLCNSGIVH